MKDYYDELAEEIERASVEIRALQDRAAMGVTLSGDWVKYYECGKCGGRLVSERGTGHMCPAPPEDGTVDVIPYEPVEKEGTPCGECRGSGFINLWDCPSCGGSGVEDK